MTNTTKTLAELVSDWETAKAMTEDAALSMRNANANHERCALAQKAAYKAMNEAIDALRPKRKKPLVTQDGTKIEPTPLEQAIAHASDCATNNGPAFPVGDCDCAPEVAREAA